jgi:L-amino acid N-acyltransferase YncA
VAAALAAVRDARAEDLPAIVAIYNETIPTRQATADLEEVSVESRQTWFERHGPGHHPLWVAEADGAVAAWLSFETWHERPAYARSAEVSVYVRSDQRRRGLGRLLLTRAIDRAPELGLRTLLGVVFAHNAGSVRLFEAFGFERWGLLPGIAELDGVERDVVILGRRV